MSEGPDRDTAAEILRNDALCDRFEDACRAGERPSIDEFLAGVGGRRDALLRELIRLDVAHRRRAGESPTPGEYVARYPELAGWIAEALSATSHLHPTHSLADPGSGPPHAPRPRAGLDDFEILGELGRGGMGVVYRVRQKSLNRLVALKMVRGDRVPSRPEAQRLYREAEAAAGLDHPGIVAVYEVGEQDGRPFVAMQLVEGGSLADRAHEFLGRHRAAAALVAAVARAVDHAHRRGVLHRDLKPSNILLDGFGRPRVADFGLAVRLTPGGDTDGTGAVAGTPAYMAPEQARGGRGLTTAADVYGLGAVLYHLLTGQPPFRAGSAAEGVRLLLTADPTPPREIRPDVPRELEAVCLASLRKDPDDRYPSAADMAADLEAYLDGRGVRVRRPGWFGALTDHVGRSHAVEPATWGAVAVWAGLLGAPVHFLVYLLVAVGPAPPVVFWAVYGLYNLALAAVFRHYLGGRGRPLGRDERHMLALWIGVSVGTAALWLVAGAPCDARLWAVYPGWAVLYGVAHFAQGSLYWGHFYLQGLGWFVLAGVMTVDPRWAAPEFGVAYALSQAALARHLRGRPA